MGQALTAEQWSTHARTLHSVRETKEMSGEYALGRGKLSPTIVRPRVARLAKCGENTPLVMLARCGISRRSVT